MSIVICPADLEGDQAALIDLYKRCLTPQSDRRRFRWLYRECPFGEARAWVAVDAATAQVVGAAALFPRLFWFDADERLGCVLGDFCVDNLRRSLGPALQLQRACLAGAMDETFQFYYDFPSAAMMAIYQRLGVGSRGKFVRFARLLRADARIAKIVKSKALARGLAAPLNLVLRRGGGHARECEIAVHAARCGDEFTALDCVLRARDGISTVRTAEYLNWRYLDCPLAKYDFLAARRNGELVGYVVFTSAGDSASIVEMHAKEEPAVIESLLCGASELLRKRGAATVSLPALEQHPWRPQFEHAGFRARESSPVIWEAKNPEPALCATSYLMQGERDS